MKRSMFTRLAKRAGAAVATRVWDVASGFFIAVMAALSSVIATKIFEPSSEIISMSGLWSAISLVVALVGYGFCLRASFYSKLEWGTAYYLSLLAPGMRDEYQEPFKRLSQNQNYQDSRVLTPLLSKVTENGFDWTNDVTSFVVKL